MAIVRDDQVGFTVHGAFENAVVTGIGGDERQRGFRNDHLRYLRDESDAPLEVGLALRKLDRRTSAISRTMGTETMR